MVLSSITELADLSSNLRLPSHSTLFFSIGLLLLRAPNSCMSAGDTDRTSTSRGDKGSEFLASGLHAVTRRQA